MIQEGYGNNQAEVAGEIISDFIYSHEVHGERFFTVEVKAKRLSGVYDVIPLMIPEKLVDINADYKGYYVKVSGQFRSHNMDVDGRRKLALFVFAKEFSFIDCGYDTEINELYLDGYVCKEPIYRKTPMGKEITDVMLAVNRQYGRADYIPCVYWGKNARWAKNLSIGDRCNVHGRIQSREYMKKISSEYAEQRVAYEASISTACLSPGRGEEESYGLC